MTSGASPPAITACIAAAPATPGRCPSRSPVEYTFVAPNSPSPAATSAPSPTTNAETEPPSASSRAFVSSSRLPVVGAPSDPCANTQMLVAIVDLLLDDLQLVEELDDLHVALAVVFDDLAGLPLGRRRDVDDLLAGAGPPDRRHAEVSGRHRVDRLGLGGHDPLEARIARLDDTGGDAD